MDVNNDDSLVKKDIKTVWYESKRTKLQLGIIKRGNECHANGTTIVKSGCSGVRGHVSKE